MHTFDLHIPDKWENLFECIPCTLQGSCRTVFLQNLLCCLLERHLRTIAVDNYLTDLLYAAVVVRLRSSIIRLISCPVNPVSVDDFLNVPIFPAFSET